MFDVVDTLQTHCQRSVPAPDYNTYIFTDNKENIVILITILVGLL